MLPTTSPILTVADVLTVIENARNAELCRDIKTLRQILQNVWNNDNRSPDFREYPPVIRAELLRIYGFYLTADGLSRKKENYQERGKDLLTNAIELFTENNLPDKAAEATVILAFCYWNAGEVSECETILKSIEEIYVQDIFHPVYLQIRINRLIVHYWNEEFDEGIQLIEEISHPMEFCADIRLKMMFHNQAGMIYRRKKMTEESAIHYHEAIRLARNNNNFYFIAATYNNLAGLYSDEKQFETAHFSISESIKILTDLNDFWVLPHALDTKAAIFFSEGKYAQALEAVDRAIEIFKQSEDSRGFAEALWTKTKCLLRLSRTEEALILFGELQQISSQRIGQPTVEKFARALTGSQILKKQFPQLQEELGFFQRKTRNDKSKRTYILSSDVIHKESEIKRVVLANKSYQFDFYFQSEKFETFYFDKFFMDKFGVETGAVVAVIPVMEIKPEMVILISVENNLILGNVKYDKNMDVRFVVDNRGHLFPLNESDIIGEPVGYCPIAKTESKFIGFSRLLKD